MASYVFSFRGQKDRTPTADDEAAWGQWFQQIGGSITDFGNRVGQTRTAGNGPSADVLSGYIVVNADSLEAATALAESCPGVRQGGGVEVGEVIPS
jgi:YCII-related domain